MNLSKLFNGIYFPFLNVNKKEKTKKKSLPLIETCCLIDWDDTLMPSTYLLSKVEIGATDYEVNEKTDRIIGFNYKLNEKLTEHERQTFITNIQKTGNATFELLSKIVSTIKPTNIKIVTCGVKGWLNESLYICAAFCEVYNKIKQILDKDNIEIIYARNSALNQAQWKIVCFDRLLCNYFNINKSKHLNIISIGDQWMDHDSIEQTFSFRLYNNLMTHHQIKLLSNPDCRYLSIELEYIVNLFDQKVLFTPHEQGLVFEFDGYN